MKRAVCVLDSVGVELPDAADFGDNVGELTPGQYQEGASADRPTETPLRLECGDIQGKDISLLGEVAAPKGCYGKMAERSIGKDTTTGH